MGASIVSHELHRRKRVGQKAADRPQVTGNRQQKTAAMVYRRLLAVRCPPLWLSAVRLFGFPLLAGLAASDCPVDDHPNDRNEEQGPEDIPEAPGLSDANQRNTRHSCHNTRTRPARKTANGWTRTNPTSTISSNRSNSERPHQSRRHRAVSNLRRHPGLRHPWHQPTPLVPKCRPFRAPRAERTILTSIATANNAALA